MEIQGLVMAADRGRQKNRVLWISAALKRSGVLAEIIGSLSSGNCKHMASCFLFA